MENTRARILTAAAQLFEQQGYRSVSMRAIAAQLGISVGNLTYHSRTSRTLRPHLRNRR